MPILETLPKLEHLKIKCKTWEISHYKRERGIDDNTVVDFDQ